MEDPPIEPAQRHLSLFLSEVRAQAPVPTLRSFLKLYASLDAAKLANFLDADEEEMVQQLMIMKQTSRSVSRFDTEHDKGLLDGQMASTSDLDFVIDGVSTDSLPRNDAVTHGLAEHGSHRRIDTRQKIRGLVHPEHGARTTRVRFPPQQPAAHPSKNQRARKQGCAGIRFSGTSHWRANRRVGWCQGLST